MSPFGTAFIVIIISFIQLSVSHSNDNIEFRFANTLGTNMVLQQEPYKSQIWGFCDIGSSVEVKLVQETNNTDTVIQNITTIEKP